jgi:hypothetical protein
MPFLKLVTNVPKSKIPPNFDVYLTELLSSVLNKPKEYCSVMISAGEIINFGGSHAPSALVTMLTVGRMGYTENAAYSAVITDELERVLGILPFQTYIRFIDAKLSAIAHHSPNLDNE